MWGTDGNDEQRDKECKWTVEFEWQCLMLELLSVVSLVFIEPVLVLIPQINIYIGWKYIYIFPLINVFCFPLSFTGNKHF